MAIVQEHIEDLRHLPVILDIVLVAVTEAQALDRPQGHLAAVVAEVQVLQVVEEDAVNFN